MNELTSPPAATRTLEGESRVYRGILILIDGHTLVSSPVGVVRKKGGSNGGANLLGLWDGGWNRRWHGGDHHLLCY